MCVKFTVQRYCTKNDNNGNPRRVYVVRDESGAVVATQDEEYTGRPSGAVALSRVMPGAVVLSLQWDDMPEVADLGDVDVAPGVYRRMLKYVDSRVEHLHS